MEQVESGDRGDSKVPIEPNFLTRLMKANVIVLFTLCLFVFLLCFFLVYFVIFIIKIEKSNSMDLAVSKVQQMPSTRSSSKMSSLNISE